MSAGYRSGVARRRVGFDPELEFLPGPERHDTPGGDRDLLPGLGVAPGALVLLAQLEVAETRELDLVAALQRLTHDLEVGVDEVLGFTFVQADLLEQPFGHFRFCYCHGWSLLLAAPVARTPDFPPGRKSNCQNRRFRPPGTASAAETSPQLVL